MNTFIGKPRDKDSNQAILFHYDVAYLIDDNLDSVYIIKLLSKKIKYQLNWIDIHFTDRISVRHNITNIKNKIKKSYSYDIPNYEIYNLNNYIGFSSDKYKNNTIGKSTLYYDIELKKNDNNNLGILKNKNVILLSTSKTYENLVNISLFDYIILTSIINNQKNLINNIHHYDSK